jgi:hypothetical protein
MKMLRWLLNRLKTANPLVATGIASAIMLMLIALAVDESLRRLLKALPSWMDIWLVLAVFVVILALPAVAMISTAVSYKRAHLGLQRLVYTFLALVLMFSDAYFVSVVLDDRGGTPCYVEPCHLDNDIPLKGVQPVWRWLPDIQGRHLSLKRIGLAYIDCFHYSLVTSSTVGFGDITPVRWYAKLLTDSQILLSLGLTVLGVSRVFAGSNRG